MLVSDIFKDVSSRLQDLGSVKRWKWDGADSSAPSLLTFLNMAIQEIVNQRPDATATTVKVSLTSGYKQTIPNDALSLIDILHAYNKDGSIACPVTQCRRKELQQVVLSQAPSQVINSYAYDKLDNPSVFWVSPAVLIGSSADVEMTYSVKPKIVITSSEQLPISSQYAPAVVNWILYEVYSGDNNDTDLARAQLCYEAFYKCLGVKIGIDRMFPVKPKTGESNG